MDNKKGQEMSTATLILIVIGIIVLVLIVIGITGGFDTILDKIRNLGGGGPNVDSIVQACTLACSSGAKYDYCSANRTINFGKDSRIDGLTKGKIGLTCAQLEAGKPTYKVELSCSPSIC